MITMGLLTALLRGMATDLVATQTVGDKAARLMALAEDLDQLDRASSASPMPDVEADGPPLRATGPDAGAGDDQLVTVFVVLRRSCVSDVLYEAPTYDEAAAFIASAAQPGSVYVIEKQWRLR